jgi:hypothetical protein
MGQRRTMMMQMQMLGTGGTSPTVPAVVTLAMLIRLPIFFLMGLSVVPSACSLVAVAGHEAVVTEGLLRQPPVAPSSSTPLPFSCESRFLSVARLSSMLLTCTLAQAGGTDEVSAAISTALLCWVVLVL